jgi:formylglycine-generating enzyme required for sulfatase activity
MGLLSIFKKNSAKGFSSSASNNPALESQVRIPSGNFIMGSEKTRKEQPVHKVVLDGFFMDRMPVTQKDYEKILGVNPSADKSDGRLPVVNITWYDMVLYCNARSSLDGLTPVYRYSSIIGKAGDGCKGLKNLKIQFNKNGYRLSTEAEWEYACRAGTTTEYYWGDTIDGAYMWWYDNADKKLNPVGMKKPNAWGLHDMLGNVWELTNDWNSKDYYAKSPRKNPRGPKTGECRVFRGGGWNHRKESDFTSAHRLRAYPDERFPNIGFRCVRADTGRANQ